VAGDATKISEQVTRRTGFKEIEVKSFSSSSVLEQFMFSGISSDMNVPEHNSVRDLEFWEITNKKEKML